MPIIPDSLIADIHKRITEAFEIFDNENNKTVDVRLVLVNSNMGLNEVSN
jgi:hypothetical protein